MRKKNMKSKTRVFCRLSVDGIHRWKDSDKDGRVWFLRASHRHVFNIECWKDVSHDDRDVEFITLKMDVGRYLSIKYSRFDYGLYDFGGMSCEMLARELLEHFNLSKCIVDEDGENGAEARK